MNSLTKASPNQAPAPAITVENELSNLYDLLVGMGSEIDRLEAALHPVIHQAQPEEQANTTAMLVVPPVIERIRSITTSVDIYVARLAGITRRLAL